MNALVILICLCVGNLGHASPSRLSDTALSIEKTVEDDLKVVKDKAPGVWNDIKKVQGACSCINYNCGCCAHLEEREIELNSTICVNVTYLAHDYGISFTVTVNHHTIYNETVSVRSPPPVCLGVPYVKEFVDACVRLYDIDANTTYLHACVRFEARMKTILVAKYDFGCFNIGPPGLSREDKLTTQPKTSVAKHAASSTSSDEHQPSKESNAAHMTVAVIAVTSGVIVLAALSIFVVIARARQRGNNAYFTHLLRRHRNYDSVVSESHNGKVQC